MNQILLGQASYPVPPHFSAVRYATRSRISRFFRITFIGGMMEMTGVRMAMSAA